MQIITVELVVTDLPVATRFFTDVLELPAHPVGAGTEVVVGRSRLRLLPGGRADGVHHLAFDVPPESFDAHRDWLEERVPLLRSADGTAEFEGPPAWSSRSVYFEGPDRMVLELIARRERPRPGRPVPHLVSVSEVGIAVPDVLQAVDELHRVLDATVLGDASAEFAPVGDHDGLLILVRPGRGWLPVFDVQARPLPLRVEVEPAERTGGVATGPLALSATATLHVGRRAG